MLSSQNAHGIIRPSIFHPDQRKSDNSGLQTSSMFNLSPISVLLTVPSARFHFGRFDHRVISNCDFSFHPKPKGPKSGFHGKRFLCFKFLLQVFYLCIRVLQPSAHHDKGIDSLNTKPSTIDRKHWKLLMNRDSLLIVFALLLIW
jgi:hypothetical protein